MKILKSLSKFVIGGLERFFYRWGKFVSRNPYAVILVSTLLTALSGIGFLNYRQEHQANQLWIPPASQYNVHQNWIDTHFKNNRRDEAIFFEAENVLTPESIQQMFELHQKIAAINIDGKTFDDICTKLPVANIFHTDKRRRKRETLVTEPQIDQSFIETVSQATLTELPEEAYEYENPWPDYLYDDNDEYYLSDSSSEDLSQDSYGVVVPRINYEEFGKLAEESEGATRVREPLPTDIHCGIVTSLKEKCLQSNLLEIWRFQEQLINTTTTQEILDAVNLLERSPWTSYKTNFTDHLGDVVRNSTGHVVSARIARLYWNIEIPEGAEIVANGGFGAALNPADAVTLAWEQQFLDIALNSSYPGVKILPNAKKSFEDVNANAIFFDAFKVAFGYSIMFVYTMIMLGRMNTLEVRFYLTVTGIMSVGMGLVVGVGLSSVMGFPYTPVHSALPFIGLGIGIDDMFVIVQCLFNIKKTEGSDLGIDESIGSALKHAGVSITITTLTDVFAFGVGAITRMPGLQSFCVCTSIALAAIYLLQISFFTAFLAIDETRIKNGRNAIVPCYVHKDFDSPSVTSSKLFSNFIKKYKKLLSSWLYKGAVLLLSSCLFGLGVWGCILIRQKFDALLLLPEHSYLRQWFDMREVYYPTKGIKASVYTGPIDHTSLDSIDRLTNSMQEYMDQGTYLKPSDLWWSELKDYAMEVKNYSSWTEFGTSDDFPMLLSEFLFSEDGGRFRINFNFDGELVCGEPVPNIVATREPVVFFTFDGPEEHIPGRRALEEAIAESEIADIAFSHGDIYTAWETDEIIGSELLRNIAMALCVVIVVTLILLANFQICFLVFVCVMTTLINIIGYLHFWYMTIDIVACVSIVLSIGLCVDYSVHVAHAYIIGKGSRLDKAVSALETIGPAVFNGGFTTFLALVLLGFSQSQIFITFFKVFVLTVGFGLFHGLILLPVLLSILGPVDENVEDIEESSVTMSSSVSPAKGSPCPSGLPNIAFVEENENEKEI